MRMIDADAIHTEISKWPESVMYKDWVQSAIATSPTIPAPQWISVEDRPPEGGQKVLVYLEDGCVQCAQHNISGYDDSDIWYLDYYYEGQGEITHWMPLPEPPDKRYKCRYADDNGVCSKLSGNGELIYCVEGPCPYDMPGEENL